MDTAKMEAIPFSETSVSARATICNIPENGTLHNAYFKWGSAVKVVRFEVFTAVTMKNGVFRNVTPCGSCK
jgi:hypothetical protein